MSDTDGRLIDQLWYTWSGTGLEDLKGEFRVRAASPNLMDVNSERMKTLRRYLSYILPVDIDRAKLELQDAPVCLALIDTGQERIDTDQERVLLQKVYTGKEGRGRSGNYFIHMIAGLPPDFSALDAIALWRYADNDLWQTHDDPERGLQLGTLTIGELRAKSERQKANIVQRIALQSADLTATQSSLPYVIQAFLVQQAALDELEQRQAPKVQEHSVLKQRLAASIAKKEQKDLEARLRILEEDYARAEKEKPRIYLAAHPDQVAYFIWALTRVLPPELLSRLTFSTYEYEYDLPKQTCLLVGTCQPPASAALSTRPREILPDASYRNGLALNLYTGRSSQLKDLPYAADFAQFAANAIISGKTQELDGVLDEIAQRLREGEPVSVTTFLSRYNLLINELKALTPEKMIEVVARADARDLRHPGVRQRLILLVMQGQEQQQNRFLDALRPHLARLGELRQNNVALDKTLLLLESDIASAIVQQARQQDGWAFVGLYNLLRYLAPVGNAPATWLKLLDQLLADRQTRSFISEHRSLCRRVLGIAARIVEQPISYTAQVRPLLEARDNDCGELLALHLPASWNLILIENFNRTFSVPLPPQTLLSLEQHADDVVFLIEQQVGDAQGRGATFSFYHKLVSSAYSQWLRLLDTWCKLLTSAEELGRLVQAAPLEPRQATQLALRYAQSYKQRNMEAVLPALYNKIVAGGAHASDLLFALLDGSPVGQHTLETLLTMAPLTDIEQQAFFARYGAGSADRPKYIGLYPQSRVLEQMVRAIADSNSPNRLTIALTWLETRRTKMGITAEDIALIERACRTTPDCVLVLSRYGPVYLQTQQTPLVNLCLNLFRRVAASPDGGPYRQQLLLQLFDAAASDSIREQLLDTARLVGMERANFILDYAAQSVPFFYQSKVASSLYQEAIRSGEISSSAKMHIVSVWLEQRLELRDLENILRISALLPIEEEEVMERFGSKYLSFYSTSPVLLNSARSYLRSFDVENFEKRDLVDNLEKRELSRQFLQFLANSSVRLPPDIQHMAKGWLHIQTCIAMPVLSPRALKALGSALFTFTREQPLSEADFASLQSKLARILLQLVNDAFDLHQILMSLRWSSIALDKIIELLCEMARAAGEMYRAQSRERILLPFMRIIPHLPDIFDDLDDQRQFTELRIRIWQELVCYPETEPEADEYRELRETFAQLSAYMVKVEHMPDWDSRITQAWQEFETQYGPADEDEHPLSVGTAPGSAPQAIGRPPLLQRIVPVLWMRLMLKLGVTAWITSVWERHHDILARTSGSLGEKRWRRLKLARDFYAARLLADGFERRRSALPKEEQERPLMLQEQLGLEQDLLHVAQELERSLGRPFLSRGVRARLQQARKRINELGRKIDRMMA